MTLEIEKPIKYFEGYVLSTRFDMIMVCLDGKSTNIDICYRRNQAKGWHLYYNKRKVSEQAYKKPEDALFDLNQNYHRWVRDKVNMTLAEKILSHIAPPISEWYTINKIEIKQ